MPTGMYLSKWNTNISKCCEVCRQDETMEHMLYGCVRIREIWNALAKEFKLTIGWKELCVAFQNIGQV